MGKKAINAANQQGSERIKHYVLRPSETIRQTPFSEGEIKAYFLGALHDGTFNKNRRFRISQKGKDWLIALKRLLRSIGYNSWIYREGKERDVYVLETLADFLNFKFNPLNCRTKEEKICYVKGFFDAEGGIPRDKSDRFYIQLVQKDKVKLDRLKKILSVLGIKTGKIHNPSQKVDPDYWRMYILASSQKAFVKDIGSWHPRKINVIRKRMMI